MVILYRHFGTAGCPEVSVQKYHSTLCNILEESRSHQNRGGSLKSRILTESMTKYKQELLNLLNPTGYVMHQQFNIQQMYVLPTLYLCVLYLSENKQRLVPLTA